MWHPWNWDDAVFISTVMPAQDGYYPIKYPYLVSEWQVGKLSSHASGLWPWPRVWLAGDSAPIRASKVCKWGPKVIFPNG